MTRRASLLPILAAVLAIAYVAWAVPFMLESSVVAIDGHRYFGLFDDAMISMRYAWNFSHGHGLVWNPGERIEGYTNLLWTLIMSAFTAVLNKAGAVLAMQIVGIAIVVGCCFLVWKLAQRVGTGMPEPDRQAFGIASVLLVLLYFPLSYWTLTGMETGLLTLLVLAALWTLERYAQRRDRGSLIVVAVLLGLAYLSREDSIIFSVPIFAYAFTLPGSRTRTFLGALGLFLLFPIGRELFRVLYYGDVLPNTYYLKLTGMPLAIRLRNGLGFTSLYLITHAVFLVVGALGFAWKPDKRKALYLVLVALPILYQIWVGGDPVRIWRMMTPAQPVAALLFGLAALELVRRSRTSMSAAHGRRLFGYLTAIAILTVNLIFTPYILLRQQWFPRDVYRLWTNTAVALNDLTTEKATVAVFAAGVVPYYTDRPAHDMLGRTDAYIAALPADISGAVAWNGMNSVPGHNKYNLDYSIKQLRPTYIEASAWGGQDITDWVSRYYAKVTYRGVQLWLLKGSADVNWQLLGP